MAEPQTLEISAEVVKEIATQVKDGLKEDIKAEVIKDLEPTISKDIKDDPEKPKLVSRGAGFYRLPYDQMSKELRLLTAIKALGNKDYAKADQYNEFSQKQWLEKGYTQNETVDADGGYLVPDADFVEEVTRLSANYGVALRDATIREVSGNSVKLTHIVSDVTLTETAEAQNVPGTKMTFGQGEVTLKGYKGNAIISRELDEDAAVSLYDLLADSFARARAKKADEIVFTDPTMGILNTAGVYAISWGAGLADMTADALLSAEDNLVADALTGAKFYLHRKALGQARRIKDSNGSYIFSPATQGMAAAINNYPFERVEVLPSVNTANEPFVVFGNLKRYVLATKRGLRLDVLTEGTVLNSNQADVNLAKTDQWAVRGVARMAGAVQNPDAFVLLGTGTVS